MARKVALSNPYGALRVFVYGSLCILAACSGGQNDQDDVTVDQQQSAVTQTSEPAGLEQQPEKLIIAFGDSLYAGYGLKQNESLPHDLEKALRRDGINARVIGAGVSGDTTAAGLKRFAFTLDGAKRKPDLVIIGLGGNDLLRGLDVQQTRTNIRAMLDELDDRDIDAMLTGMMAPLNMGDDYVEAFNSIYTDVAKEYDAALYPFFFDGIIATDGTQQPNLMLPDGIHPNAKGIDVVVERLAPAVRQELVAE
ncbi:arylesterase [Sphingorhabdus sp. Alg239-R122]|uniref:arylesterase n=1 Tax=Sphingorhabdus sp. Alg239-R122 TaxID=2305989 RepID=UPI0013DBF29F|nr:arylesterase [Sphingorhabdus sp. Alg239-R122]